MNWYCGGVVSVDVVDSYLLHLVRVVTSTCAGTRFSDGDGSSNEVQRTMLELINQLDGFDPRGNIKVLMATNRSVPHAYICTQ